MTLSITEQDKKLLSAIGIGESGGSYTAVNGVRGGVSQLTSMTIPQVIAYAKQVGAGSGSGAVGKYQFIPGTLSGIFKKSGLPDTTIFSPDVQDYLIVETIKGRGLDSWKGGGLTDDKFMLNLAKEFASIPVPYATSRPASNQWPARNLSKGQSYYEGVSGNRATHDPDDFIQKLADIRTGGPGSTITLSQDAAASATGNLPMTQAEISAGGGQRLWGGQGTAYSSTLPQVSDPYLYVPISAESNRYDFRTGKKVNNLLVNGTNPVSNSGLTTNNGRPPVDDLGVQALTPEQKEALTKNRVSVGYGSGKVDPALARAAGITPGPSTPQSSTMKSTPSGTSQGPKPLPTASGGMPV